MTRYARARTMLLLVPPAHVPRNQTHVYKGEADKSWTIGTVMHGGCALALVVSALLNHQKQSAHPDPAHVSAQFLTATVAGPVEILVKNVSVSKRWTRVEARMFQAGVERVRTHSQFTDLPPADDDKVKGAPSDDNPNCMPETNSPYARWCPMLVPPSRAKETPLFGGSNFKQYVKWAENSPLEDAAPQGRQRLEWAGWLELLDDSGSDVDPRISLLCVTFAADMFRNGIEILPRSNDHPASSWYPTLTFAIEYKTKFPIPDRYAPRTVGMYSLSNFITEGRHDQTVEVWSAPNPIAPAGSSSATGTPDPTDDEWRREAKILAVSTQMALTVPFSVNKSRM